MRAFFKHFHGPTGSGVKGIDPLLTAARVLLYVLLAGVALAMAFSVLGLMIYVASHIAKLLTSLAPPAWEPVIAHVAGLGMLALIASSVLALLGMIAAVEQGASFQRENGRRLEKIATNVLGMQVLGLVAAMAGLPIRGDINGFPVGVKLSPAGIAVVLLLFVLARVFRQGAVMREDLEGTV